MDHDHEPEHVLHIATPDKSGGASSVPTARSAGAARRKLRTIRRSMTSTNFRRYMFIVYATFTLTVVTISVAFLMAYFGRTLEREIYQSGEYLLRQVQQSSDALIASATNTPISNLLTVSSSNYFIDGFLRNRADHQSGLFRQTYNELVQISVSNRYIESIYLYRTADDTLISSREGLVLQASVEDPRKASFTNTALLHRATGMQSTRAWVSPLENASYWSSRPVISVIQAVPMYPVFGAHDGYVIINVDVETFARSIGGRPDSFGGRTFAVDPAGRVFLHSDPQALLAPLPDGELLTDVITSQTGSGVRNVNGVNTAILWTRSAVSDWVYVSYLPLESLNRQVFRSRQVSLLFVGLVAILSIVGVELISRYVYRFMLRITRSARRTLAMQGLNAEDPTFLDSILERLAARAREIDEVNDRNRALAVYKLSVDLLHGNVHDVSTLRERCELVRKQFHLRRYALVLIEPDSRVFTHLSFEQQEYVRYRTIELAEARLTGCCNPLSADMPGDHVVVIINFDLEEDFRSRLPDLLSVLESETGIDHNIAVTEATDSPARIRGLYERGQECLQYRFAVDYGNLYTPEFVHEIETGSLAFPFDELRQYEVLLRSRRYDRLKEELDALFEAIETCRYSLPVARNVLYEIVNIVAWVSEEQRLEATELERNELLSAARRVRFVSHYRRWLLQVVDIFGESRSATKTAIRSQFLEQVTAYICEHLDNELSLQSVAEAFSVSQSHLSRVFKEGEGVKFHDYVLAAKIERAFDLLAHEPDLTVSEISRGLGYHDLAYFARIFRERCGMAPTEYRRRHAEYPRAQATVGSGTHS